MLWSNRMAEIASSRYALFAITTLLFNDNISAVIASGAKQSRLTYLRRCLVRRFRRHLFLREFVCAERHRRRAAHPGGLPSKLSVSNPSPLQQRVAERRNSQPRIAATVGSPYGRTNPVCETGLPAHNACRRASRRPTAAFSLDPETALLETDRGAHSRTPLIPRGFPRFHPLQQPVAGRTHVVGPGDVSRGPRRFGCVGRTRRRHVLLRQQASPVDALK